MERVEQNGEWCLMCPSQCPGLSECWGKEFEELYTRYEKVTSKNKRYMRRNDAVHFFRTQNGEIGASM